MARTAQIARDSSDPQTRWIQREYLDHQGNPVILGKEGYEHEFFNQWRLKRADFKYTA